MGGTIGIGGRNDASGAHPSQTTVICEQQNRERKIDGESW